MTIREFGEYWKRRYRGKYDHMSDEAVGSMVLVANPTYQKVVTGISSTVTVPAIANTKPEQFARRHFDSSKPRSGLLELMFRTWGSDKMRTRTENYESIARSMIGIAQQEIEARKLQLNRATVDQQFIWDFTEKEAAMQHRLVITKEAEKLGVTVQQYTEMMAEDLRAGKALERQRKELGIKLDHELDELMAALRVIEVKKNMQFEERRITRDLIERLQMERLAAQQRQIPPEVLAITLQNIDAEIALYQKELNERNSGKADKKRARSKY